MQSINLTFQNRMHCTSRAKWLQNVEVQRPAHSTVEKIPDDAYNTVHILYIRELLENCITRTEYIKVAPLRKNFYIRSLLINEIAQQHSFDIDERIIYLSKSKSLWIPVLITHQILLRISQTNKQTHTHKLAHSHYSTDILLFIFTNKSKYVEKLSQDYQTSIPNS